MKETLILCWLCINRLDSSSANLHLKFLER